MVDLLGNPAEVNSVIAVGVPLFSQWILPFEVVSILLLAAIVGAVALTRKRL
jgi:NADH-quinone oxidoreductase subunit J